MDKSFIYITMSIVIAVIGVILSVNAQVELYNGYLETEGKTRMLYGLQHLKYLKIGWFYLASLVFSFVGIDLKNKKKLYLSLVGIMTAIIGGVILFHHWYSYFLDK